MKTFSQGLKDFAKTVDRRNRKVFLQCAAEVDRSVRVGSGLTGSQGQPVDTGFLRSSVALTFPTKNTALITIGAAYAIYIEEGGNARGPFTFRSRVGGAHSVKLTRAGWPLIVDFVVDEVFNDD